MEPAYLANPMPCLPLSVPHLISLSALGSSFHHSGSRFRIPTFGSLLGLARACLCSAFIRLCKTCLAPPPWSASDPSFLWLFYSLWESQVAPDMAPVVHTTPLPAILRPRITNKGLMQLYFDLVFGFWNPDEEFTLRVLRFWSSFKTTDQIK